MHVHSTFAYMDTFHALYILCVQVAVAVKTLYGRQEVQSLFIKEANSMTSLNHKHIIQLYGIVLSQPLMLVSQWVWFTRVGQF